MEIRYLAKDDMMGKVIHAGQLTENVTSIDVSKWLPGMYTYSITSDGKLQSTAKFIKID